MENIKWIKLDELPLSDEDKKYVKDYFKDYRAVYDKEEWLKETYYKHGLIIRNYEIPEQYETKEDHYNASGVKYETISKTGFSNLLILIPNDYPMMPLDMFYFNPELQRKDGGIIHGLSDEIHFSVKWQRWSRHYRWDSSLMDLSYHLHYIQESIKQNQDYIKEMKY